MNHHHRPSTASRILVMCLFIIASALLLPHPPIHAAADPDASLSEGASSASIAGGPELSKMHRNYDFKSQKK